MANKQKITCGSCSKPFIITSQLTKVKCPECGVINQLAMEGGTQTSTQNKDAVPHFSIQEASSEARRMLEESTSFWVDIKVPHAEVDSCYKRVYGYDKDGNNEVFVTKAKTFIKAPMNWVLEVYWNGEYDWDNSTVAVIKLIENNGNNRLMLKEHKTTSAATLRNDLVVRSVYEEYSDHIWCYATSEVCPTVVEKGGWRRGHVVFAGLLISAVDGQSCEASYVSCFDFGGWIHVKFIDEEQKKVAMRLSKIKKKAEDDFRKAHPGY